MGYNNECVEDCCQLEDDNGGDVLEGNDCVRRVWDRRDE
jgi:hypothetical protein